MTRGRISYYLCGKAFGSRWRPHISHGGGLLGVLRGHTEVTDPDHAQLLIASESIESLKEFHKVLTPSHFSLQLCLEAVFPDFNFFDWAISFVPDDLRGRNFRPHPHVIFAEAAGIGNEPFTYIETAKAKSFSERSFCDFIYSNPDAHPFRDEFFRALNSRQPVSSLGRHLNGGNVTFAVGADFQKNWVDASISAKKSFRFSIAIENSKFDGYTSEKLLTSFAAGSVPLYWGSRHIKEDFNELRFINLNNFELLQDAIDSVVSISQSQQDWERIVSEPIFSSKQSMALEINRSNHGDFFDDVIQSISTGAARRGVGYWPTKYSKEVGRALPPAPLWTLSNAKKRLVGLTRRSAIGDAFLTRLSETVVRLSAKRKNQTRSARK